MLILKNWKERGLNYNKEQKYREREAILFFGNKRDKAKRLITEYLDFSLKVGIIIA